MLLRIKITHHQPASIEVNASAFLFQTTFLFLGGYSATMFYFLIITNCNYDEMSIQTNHKMAFQSVPVGHD